MKINELNEVNLIGVLRLLKIVHNIEVTGNTVYENIFKSCNCVSIHSYWCEISKLFLEQPVSTISRMQIKCNVISV